MNRTCHVVIDKCECVDPTVLNISAEAADPLIFYGIGYPPYRPIPCLSCGPKDYKAYCYGVEFSYSSQEEADLAALLFARICTEPPCVGPDCTNPTGLQYSNDAQTVFWSCGPLSMFWYTVPAGTFVSPLLNPSDGAAWLAAANAQALAYAQQKAAEEHACIVPSIDPTPGWGCFDEELIPEQNTYEIEHHGFRTFTFSYSGSLPPGISLVQTGPTTAVLSGKITGTGTFNYTITAVSTGIPTITVSIDDVFVVLGITNYGPPLTEGQCDKNYSYQLDLGGGEGALTVELIEGGFPTGITMTDQGLISGIPTDPPTTNYLKLRVSDSRVDDEGVSDPRTCDYETSLTINGPKIYCPADATICTPYNGQLLVYPSGCIISASLPSCLNLNPANGAITGTPYSLGSVDFTVTDPITGNVGNKICDFIKTDGSGKSAMFKDVTWTNTVLVIGSITGNGASGVFTMPVFPVPCSYPTGSFAFESNFFKNCAGKTYKILYTLTYALDRTRCEVGGNYCLGSIGFGTVSGGDWIGTSTIGDITGGGVYSGSLTYLRSVLVSDSYQFWVHGSVRGYGTALTFSVTAVIDPDFPIC